MAVYNEAPRIESRLCELLSQLSAANVVGEMIVVSDSSTDETAEILRSNKNQAVCFIDLPTHVGKAAALTVGCRAAVNEIIVFADARQTWAPDALGFLLENFADPQVGAVSGDLVIESGPGVLAGIGLYWRFEKQLRRNESAVHSLVGVTGAISAVRRSLFRDLPAGITLDDIYWPLCVVMQGYRVVHDRRAQAFDRLPVRVRDEYRRKVRTLTGNLQLLTVLPAALLPWRNPIWWQFVSHKLLRMMCPWALLGMLCLSLYLPEPLYQAAFWSQLLFYGLGLVGLCAPRSSRFRPAAFSAAFMVLNSAAWFAFWIWITGRASASWQKVSYQSVPTAAR